MLRELQTLHAARRLQIKARIPARILLRLLVDKWINQKGQGMIQRYEPDHWAEVMREESDGEFVLFSDHEQAMKEKLEELDEIKKCKDCPFCGQRQCMRK